MNNDDWYLGLDIGTNSVGWAVTDMDYNVMKFRGKGMWGVHLFDSANQAADRRKFRTARRRLDRRQQRVTLVQNLFAREISKVDENFYMRIKESALFAEDRTANVGNQLFVDGDYSDKNYYKQYPTIHHLIMDLIENDKPHDVRLVYLACAYFVAHRGHFLNPVSKDKVGEVTQIEPVYDEFMKWFDAVDVDRPWNTDIDKFKDVLSKKMSVSEKEKEFIQLLFNGKKPRPEENSVGPNVALIIKLLSGGKVQLSSLFGKEIYDELDNKSLNLGAADLDDKLETNSADMDEVDVDLLYRMKALFDWSLLTNILNGERYISRAKVNEYETHKSDLKLLKLMFRKYLPNQYDNMFKKAINNVANYVSYSHNVSSLNDKLSLDYKWSNKEEFCEYTASLFKSVVPEDQDKEKFDDMMTRLSLRSFCPKQVNGDNRVIPYQLYWYEMNEVLSKAEKYLPFLSETDEYGTIKRKLLSIMEFRIPYYVGPLVSTDKSSHAWMKKYDNAPSEKIMPWNFDRIVDLDSSEKEFIRRMTNKCTYYMGKDVLPKNSLIYSKFMVLNEINNIKINEKTISVEAKQRIFTELFEKHRKVSVKSIKELLICNGYMTKTDVLSGIDVNIKSSLKSFIDFKEFISVGKLKEKEIEDIILHITCSTDKQRVIKFLGRYSSLTPEDIKRISNFKYIDFGRLSYELLTQVYDLDISTGEIRNGNMNIIQMMWETNINLMELLSNKYGYSSHLKQIKDDYYSNHPFNVSERLEDLYISNAVKRPILRTLDIVKELKGIKKSSPRKIFIEMARDVGGAKKGVRTVSRRDQIIDLYRNFPDEEVKELRNQLDLKTDNELKKEVLFLYFIQLGKCLYSGESIDIDKIGTSEYNIDHIYPQSLVKDDSIDNKVLVLSKINDAKKAIYPIDDKIRAKMSSYWYSLKDKKLISEKKYDRLIRSSSFTDEELAGFINRQLVETRQSTKAVASLLQEIYPDSRIVYVKAGLVSEFRNQYNMLKCREVNNLHHAKDAYLNIVIGNVYDTKFTLSPLNYVKTKEPYSMNMESLLSHDIERDGVVAWRSITTISTVKKMMQRNNINYVVYTYIRKGGFYRQNPERANLASDMSSLVQKKAGLQTSKYGGYNNTTAACFRVVKYYTQKTEGIIIIPIELLYLDRILHDDEFSVQYCFDTVNNIVSFKKGDTLQRIEFPFARRMVKVNTLVEIDGFRATLIQKDSKGKYIVISSTNSLQLSEENYLYIKRLASWMEKCKTSKREELIDDYSKIYVEDNERILNCIVDKMKLHPYDRYFSDIATKIQVDKFKNLSIENQVRQLMEIVSVLYTGRESTCNLELVGGAKKSAKIKMNSDVSKSGSKELRIIDQSATGLFESRTDNLITL